MRKLALGAASALLFFATAIRAQDITIETRKEGQNFDHYKEVEGQWIDSNQGVYSKSSAEGLTTSGKCGSRKSKIPGVVAARFFPRFSAPGHFLVYTTWGKAGNAVPVNYIVHHAGGESTKVLMQAGWGNSFPSNAGKWVLIGEFDFKVGEEQYVELRTPADSSSADSAQLGQVHADAVRFASKPLPESDVTTAEPRAKRATATATPPPAIPQIIIETRKEGMNFDHYQETTGTWQNSGDDKGHGKSKAPGLSDATKCGTRKVFCSGGRDQQVPLPASAAARFVPMLPVGAHYYVYVTWPREANAAPVQYVIHHAKGEETKVLRQDGWGVSGQPSNANRWNLLGDFDFAAGEDQWVEVRKNGDTAKAIDPANYGQIYADAVEFSLTPLAQPGVATPAPTNPTPGEASATGLAPLTVLTQPTGAATNLSEAMDTGPLNWMTDLGAAQTQGAQQNRRILLFFYTSESATSRYFEEKVFSDPEVKGALQSRYVLVRLNFAENAAVAGKLTVFKAGTVLLFDSSGNFLNKIETRLTSAEFAAALK